MKRLLYLINNFAHDLFTGIWFGTFVGILIVHAKAARHPDMPAESAIFISELNHYFFWLGVVSLLLVMITGWIRFLYRREWDALEAPGHFKKPVLIVKHILLGSAFIAGSFYAYQWTY